MEAILEQWVARMAQASGGETAQFLTREKDPFRNPVGHLLRENLAVLLQELLGEMDPSRTGPALDALLRVHAVQDLTASQAVGFIFWLRPLLATGRPDLDPQQLNQLIDQLALQAFEGYVRCREQLAEIRLGESRRSMAILADRSQRKS